MKFLIGVLVATIFSAQAMAAPQCTTTEVIQFPYTIPASEFTAEQQRRIVEAAVYYKRTEPKWDDYLSPSNAWKYERESDGVIYIGMNRRSHYLQIAATLSDAGITTIVCDSSDLKQKETSIHKKVPGWKDTLDKEIALRAQRALQMGMPE